MRLISEAEAVVVETVLAKAAVLDVGPSTFAGAHTLQVVKGCDCGCASVDFEIGDEGSGREILAEAVGLAPDGDELGIIIWGVNGRVTALEIYNYSDRPARLPVLESIRPYGEETPLMH